MRFSLQWLSRYLQVQVPTHDLLEKLTLSGTEVERWEEKGVREPLVVVAQVESSRPHPNADRLRLCEVLDGTTTRRVVCGAKNFQDGDKVALALPGARLPGGLTIKESKIRGELSQGMLCSAKELALAEDAEGLLILPADAPVGRQLGQYLPGDTLVELEVTSNRPDLLCYRGIAREIAATGAGTIRANPAATVSYPNSKSTYTAGLEALELCPLYSAVFLRGLKIGPSPQWLQQAIVSTGHRPINNVVDITNFVLFETGQPLHAFDARLLNGAMLSARPARLGETLLALDDKTYALIESDLVIADDAGPVAIAGVMGGKATGVDLGTTEIVLEAAWFDPASVRRTSHRLNLMSESSHRYERRVDPSGLLAARDRAVQLFVEIAGAEVVEQPFAVGNLPVGHGPIQLRSERLAKVLGAEVPSAEIEIMLTQLGCTKISSENQAMTRWQPPSYRHDLAREIDLIEEVARLQGMDRVRGRVVTGAQPQSNADRAHERQERLRRVLASCGWDECVTDALIEQRVLGEGTALQLANPLSEAHTHLRPALRPALLQAVEHNLSRGVSAIRLFELGRVYRKLEAGDTAEPLHLGMVVAGLGSVASWSSTERPIDFFDLQGGLDFLLRQAGLEKSDVLEAGAVPPAVLRLHGIKSPVFYAELALDAWLLRTPQPERFLAPPAFPPARRDLAVVVGKAISQAEVERVFWAAKVPQLESVQLFDLFMDPKGEKLAAELKSLAYALTYRAPDRTLTEREVNEAQEQVRKTLMTKLNCSFRE